MITLINRSAFLEVRCGRNTIFRRSKPYMGGGLSAHLLDALRMKDVPGLYIITTGDVDVTMRVVELIEKLSGFDGRSKNYMPLMKEILDGIREAPVTVETVDKGSIRVNMRK